MMAAVDAGVSATVVETSGTGTCAGLHQYATAGTFNVTVNVVDDDTGALRQRGCSVLTELGPGDDVEERRLLLPFAVLLVTPIDREAE
jgi:hypothetical protein